LLENKQIMIVKPIYTYELIGRRPAMIFVLIVSVLLMIIAASYSAPWYFLLPIFLSGAMAFWAVIANPKTGSTLTTEALHFFNRGTPEIVQINDIVSMKITSFSDGPDTITLNLVSGRVVHVPSICADSKLAVSLRSLGITEVYG
jgi:hypothetical protein